MAARTEAAWPTRPIRVSGRADDADVNQTSMASSEHYPFLFHGTRQRPAGIYRMHAEPESLSHSQLVLAICIHNTSSRLPALTAIGFSTPGKRTA